MIRLQKLGERIYPDSQCGFRAERSTIDMVLSLRQLQEKRRDQHTPLEAETSICPRKQAEILSIPKVSQVTSLAKHLRPIALTPALSKVLESFVVSWMRRATVHSETQFGGIKDSSTTLALITMLHYVLQRLEKNNTYARILLIDFSKAFDHIDHNILLDKLKTNGVPQICVEWQKAFLTSRTQRVKLANSKSDWTEVGGGVPQGTLSGPENF